MPKASTMIEKFREFGKCNTTKEKYPIQGKSN